MRLYLVRRTDSVDYDEYDAVVVRARNAQDAVSIACTNSGNDAAGDFYFASGFAADGSNAKAEPIPAHGKRGVVLGSFNAG